MFVLFQQKKVYYTCMGTGSTIVLLHGFLENSSMWNSFIPRLSKNYQVLTIDLPGHGQTDCFESVHTMELMADVVYKVVQHLGLSTINLVGHSMGGYVALAYAEKYSKEVATLLLLNSTAQEDSPERKRNRDRANRLAAKNMEKYIRSAMTNPFSPVSQTNYKAERALAIEQALLIPLKGLVAAHSGMKIRKDRQHVLSKFKGKKLHIIGKYDTALNFEAIVNEAIATSTDFIVLETGHMAPIDDFDQVALILNNNLPGSLGM